MNLIANGCSFTAGVPIDPKGPYDEIDINLFDFHNYSQTVPHAWPYQFDDFTTYNIALGGSGNQRILRTTMSLLDKAPQEFIDDSIFVIQWSTTPRKEYWYNELPYDVDESGACLIPPYRHDQKHDHSYDHQNTVDKATQEAAFNHKYICGSLALDLYESLVAIVTLTHALEQYNAKFLYTALQWNNLCVKSNLIGCNEKLTSIPDDFSVNGYHQALLNLLPWDNMIESINGYLKNDLAYYLPNDGHPNPQGNKLFANYVKQEMEKRNWLT